MRKNKNLLKRAAAIAAMSTMIVSQAPLVSAFAYGEYDVSVHSKMILTIQQIFSHGLLMYGREGKKLLPRQKILH